MTRFRMLVLFIVVLGFISGCARQTGPDTRTEDERVIRELEIEAWRALETKDLERVMSLYAEDASALPKHPPVDWKRCNSGEVEDYFCQARIRN